MTGECARVMVGWLMWRLLCLNLWYMGVAIMVVGGIRGFGVDRPRDFWDGRFRIYG